ncbi:unnamed protein product, partial [Tetraodon nigroviridis]
KRYNRDFLLGCQFVCASMHRPEGLPAISDVVLDKVNKTPLRPADPARLMNVGPDFTPSYLGNLGSRSVGGPRGPGDEHERLKLELEEAKDQARRRSLGNMRFIGELFKLKMLTEAIMHDCVVKLLKNHHDEESLECLCRLLSTIGKDLDFEKAKPRMDQYFNQMDKIIKERKTSSRIRFMLQDVLDLRTNNWVPRRADQGPKTIDQIHKEAEMEEQREHIKVQHHLLSKKDGGGRMGGGMGGRGPHAQGGGRTSQPQDEGWNTVPISKNRPIDATRFSRITKGAKAHGGVGAKVAVEEVEQNQQVENKILTGQQPAPLTASQLCNSLVHCYRQLTLIAEFLTAPVMSVTEGKVTGIASIDLIATRVDKAEMTGTVRTNLPREALAESLRIAAAGEAIQCVTELNSASLLFVFVRCGIEYTLERSTLVREHLGRLLHNLVKGGILPTQQYYKGLEETLEAAEDIAIDIPHIWLYLAELITPMLHEGGIPMGQLFREISKPLVPLGKAGLLLVKILKLLCKGMTPKKVGAMWADAQLNWNDFLPEDQDMNKFVTEQEVEFTMGEESKSTEVCKKVLSGAQLIEELDRLLEDKASDQRIIDWVEANLDEAQTTSNQFIRALMTSVCQAAIICENPYKMNSLQIIKRASLLQKYLCDEQKELQALFALQALMVHMEQPANLLRMFFDTLYDEDIIKEEAFYKWESSKDPAEQTGKGVALKSVTAFFTWLREAEEESD